MNLINLYNLFLTESGTLNWKSNKRLVSPTVCYSKPFLAQLLLLTVLFLRLFYDFFLILSMHFQMKSRQMTIRANLIILLPIKIVLKHFLCI